jgi:transketolase C-terminal domain/subunit
VAQVVASNAPVPMQFIGLRTYAKSGKAEELLEQHGLTASSIEEAVRTVISKKSRL